MKRISSYIGVLFVACCAMFSLPALASPATYMAEVSRQMIADVGAPGAESKMFGLTMAMWRNQSQGDSSIKPSGMRAESNHFVLAAPKITAVPDWPEQVQA